MKNHRSSGAPLLSSKRWLAYATAGLATTAGSAASVDAAIHYSGVIDQVFDGTSEHRHRDFPLSQGVSLSFSQFASGAHIYDIAYFAVKGAAVSNAFRGYNQVFVSRVRPNKDVAAGTFLPQPDRFPAILVDIYGYGDFAEQGYGFITFRFDAGGGKQYGWARVKMSGAPRNRFVVVDFAWADPGESIKTGQKSAADSSGKPPEESALGFLALGSAGLLAWRRLRQPSA